MGDGWSCPACGRSKLELLQWAKRIPNSLQADRTPYWSWLAVLHEHHDHRSDPFGRDPEPAQFPATVICGQCNTADGTAKKRLGLPGWFSFSPQQIRQFVTATPPVKHTLDLPAAARIWLDCGDAGPLETDRLTALLGTIPPAP